MIRSIPHRSGASVATIEVPRIIQANGVHHFRRTDFRYWSDQYVKVITHEHVSVNFTSKFEVRILQEIGEDAAVFIVEEYC